MRAANTIINPNAGWAGLASGGGAEEACVHVLVNT